MYDRSLDIFAPHNPPSPLSLYPDRTRHRPGCGTTSGRRGTRGATRACPVFRATRTCTATACRRSTATASAAPEAAVAPGPVLAGAGLEERVMVASRGSDDATGSRRRRRRGRGCRRPSSKPSVSWTRRPGRGRGARGRAAHRLLRDRLLGAPPAPRGGRLGDDRVRGPRLGHRLERLGPRRHHRPARRLGDSAGRRASRS